MKYINVLHVYRTCYPVTKGGVEEVIRTITEGCKTLGVNSRVLALTDNSTEQVDENGIELFLVKKNFEIASNSFSLEMISVFKVLSRWADIIHFHYPWPSGDLLSFISSKPYLVTYHSDIVKQKTLKFLYNPVEFFFLRRAKFIVATSPNYAMSSSNLIKYKAKVRVIPLALEEKNFEFSDFSRFEYWKNKLGSDFFLFVGVLRYYKGLDYLIEAVRTTNIHVVIAGDGPERKRLEAKVHELGISNIIFLGFISDEDKTSLLKLCRAFVFPSHLRSEAFGVSLLEAQLYSKPIISCDVGTGSSYVNLDGVTGLVVPPKDPSALRNAINILHYNNELCVMYGNNGRKRFDDLFRNEKQCNEYVKLYNELV